MATLFVAGASGAIGSLVVPKARAAGLRVIPHLRPKTALKHPLGKDAGAAVFDLADAAKLDQALASADGIACLVGTTRRRFDQGDTYEASDYQPVVDLIAAAKRAGGGKHVTLLTSAGARAGSGYLGWKWKAEEALRQSGLPWAILRPGFFDDPAASAQPSDGKPRRTPAILSGAVALLGVFPGLGALADRIKPILVDDVAAAVVAAARDRPAGVVFEGKALRELAASLSASERAARP